MHCSSCGKKQSEKFNFCSECGTQLEIASNFMGSLGQVHSNQLISINKARKLLLISFIAVYFFLFLIMAFRDYDPYYYVNFFPYGLLQVLMILSAISFATFSYKISSLLRKKTSLIIIYTLIAPFILINFIPLIGLLADSKKIINSF